MKRIGCLILWVTICTVITSCGANKSNGINYETLYKSQPIVYQSGRDLYIVKEDNKPKKIVSDRFDPINGVNVDNFMFDVNGIFRVSYDSEWLAFAQTDKKDNGKISLQLANTNKEKVTQICDDLSVFTTSSSVRQFNPFKFATNGDLYYLINNTDALTTDLYIYKNGKSKLVASNVVNFYISQDNKKIMYTSGNEYTEDKKPKQVELSDNFMINWHNKYDPRSFTLNLYDTKSKKIEVISKNTDANQYNYDMKTISFVDYYEKDNNGTGVKKHYGEKSQYAQVCDNCWENPALTSHIDEDTHIIKDIERNGWFLECTGKEPDLIEEIEFNASLLPGEYKPLVNELNFIITSDKVYYSNRSLAWDDSKYNLFSFTIKDGAIHDKKEIDKLAELTLKLGDGVIYNTTVYDRATETDLRFSCYYDEKITEFKNVPYIDGVYTNDNEVYVTTKKDENSQLKDLYSFNNLNLEKIDTDIRPFLFYANNKLHYFKEKNIYQNKKIICKDIEAATFTLYDVNY